MGTVLVRTPCTYLVTYSNKIPNSNLTLNTLLNEDGRHLSSVGLLGGDNPEGEADTAPCKGGPFSALTPSMWPAKGTPLIYYS